MPTYSFSTATGATGAQGLQGPTGTLQTTDDLVVSSISCSNVTLDSISVSSVTCSGTASFGGVVSGPTASFSSITCSGNLTVQSAISGPTASFTYVTCSGTASFGGVVSGPTGSFQSITCSGTGTFSGTLASSGLVDSGYSVLGNYNGGSQYSASGIVGVSAVWNQSNGGREISLMNNDFSGNGFVFRQKTGTSTSSDLFTMTSSGMTVAGTLSGATGAFTSLNFAGSTSTSCELYRNRIINGDMRIDQRNNGAALTNVATIQYLVDKWGWNSTQAGKFTIQQSTVAPSGFTNSLSFTVISAYTVAGSDFFVFQQTIEGYRMADLQWGTSYAKSATLSFWVRSSIAGTYALRLTGFNNSRYFVPTYTITTADTFQYVSITIPGDTSGTWVWDSTSGFQVLFTLAGGPSRTQASASTAWTATNALQVTNGVNLVGTLGATFYITGVQFEKRSMATPFEYRLYADEFITCQRYYQVVPYWSTLLNYTGTSAANATCLLQTPMRAAPTLSFGTGTFSAWAGSFSMTSSTAPTVTNTSTQSVQFLVTGLSAVGTSGYSGYLYGGPTIAASSEI